MTEGKRVRSSSATLQILEPQPGMLYSLESVVNHTGVSRRSILVYCRSGLISPRTGEDAGGMAFDEEAIYNIRRIEHLRETHGINLTGVRMILQLMDELRRLQNEMRFQR